jgi:hypothetical protein
VHLAVFYDRRTGIGAGYGIDLATGAPVYRTRPGPHGRLAAAAEPGWFLVGLQGYGAFETRLVDREGRIATTWPSHGIALPGDPVRIVELENRAPSRCRFATLYEDGSVHHGAALPGYYTSSVVIAADGSAVFWRDDALMWVSPDGKRLERLLATPHGRNGTAFKLAGRAPGRLAMSWSTSSFDDAGRWQRNHRLLIIDVQ